MNRYIVLVINLIGWFVVTAGNIDLSGKWAVKLERVQAEISIEVPHQTYQDSILLPGALHTQGYGDDVTAQTKWYSGNLSTLWYYHPMYEKYRQPGNIKIFDFLQPQKHYIGKAWYKRTIEVPDDINSKQCFLYLERVHWQSTLYVNGHLVGSNQGLGTAHEYNISRYVKPGKNEIALCIDNSQIVDIGRIPHSISEQTMAAWNGVLGKMQLRIKDKIRIDEVQVFPDYEKKQAIVKIKVANAFSSSEKIQLRLKVQRYNSLHKFSEKEVMNENVIKPDTITTLEIVYPFDGKVQEWNEYNPSLYQLKISLESAKATDTATETFGFRDLKLKGRRFALNDRTISIRGNLNCGEFPLDGLPEMGVNWWKKIFMLHKEWGHNMVRFHSWCPPEAAFIAADEVGIYLQPEAGEWGAILTSTQEKFITEETDRMIRQYGNHPSWVFFAMGNELRCDTKIMERFIARNKQDNRRFVTGKINGRPLLESFDFASSHSVNQKRVRHHMGWPPRPETNLLYHMSPNTNYDYSEPISEFPKPFLAHEIGQYCVFPDYQHELPKYTGSVRATVLDIQKDQMEERGMTKLAPAFSMASGCWQMELLKSEYEAILRTPEMAGFYALSLQDFPGQTHAPVGVMDAFWEAKKHAFSGNFRQFCNNTVLLARIPKLILQQKDTFRANVELYNFAEGILRNKQIQYTITDEDNRVILKGNFKRRDYANQQSNLPVGKIVLPLKGEKASSKYTLHLKMDQTFIENQWNFWVFPDKITLDEGAVKVVNVFDEQTIRYLEQGHNVLWLTDHSKLKGELPTSFASMYWTAFGLNDGESMTNSIFCDPKHPLFRFFPTEMHTNWQWWDVLKYAVPVILDEFGARKAFPKSYQPVLQAIDSWKVNRKLALLAEMKYAKGKLMISGIDFTTDMENRAASRQLYYSLIQYMNSTEFDPQVEVDKETVLSVYGKPENNLKNAGVTIISENTHDDVVNSRLFDGDNSTIWEPDSVQKNEGAVCIHIKTPFRMKGLTLLSPAKEIYILKIFHSQDGVHWEQMTFTSSQQTGGKQVLLFGAAVQASYLKITFETFVPKIAEIDCIYADALPVEG